jgi:predicted alpha/beta superfamily hydrolase
MKLHPALLLKATCLAAAITLSNGCAAPATRLEATTPRVTLTDSQEWLMQASGSHRNYRIFVSMPDKPAPANGYSVLYVLDGNAMFFTAVEAVRAYERRPDVDKNLATIVVGVGYPDAADISVERTLDMTPVATTDPRVKAPAGGADAFLAFIEDDLKPRVAKLGAIDPTRQALFGHSFGGLFVLHSLAKKPDAFAVRIAASPSIWFENGMIKPQLADVAKTRSGEDARLRILLTAGEFEQKLSPAARALADSARIAAGLQSRAQVDNGREVVASLTTAGGFDARFDEIAGEDHGSVIPAAISRAVSFLLATPLPVPAVPSAIAYFEMTPEQRYDLRLRVRDLPDHQRIPWLNQLKQTLHDGLSKEQVEALHSERNAMDQQHGTRPHAVNASG